LKAETEHGSGPSRDALKKAAKATAAEEKLEKQRKTAKVIISLQSRGKNKSMTNVSGLELHGLELKKMSKGLGKKFASGASVTKNAEGKEELQIQGDLRFEIEEWLVDEFDIPEKLIVVEEPKKKSAS
jgi:density-regulated protein DRP1